ncbi:MAG: 3-hydroxybutyrate dehydrogenase [Armatimonadota bacterium]|nr:3-hydroxybutyrate dehydrogenase [Armatimonadota bacterium]
MAGSLAGKAALVTGGASGIGFAIAQALAREGAAIGIADLDVAAGQQAARRIAEGGGSARAFPADVARADAVRAMVDAAVAALGRLDILVNNAGLQYVCPIADYPEDEWDRLIGVMLTGTFLCTKYALPHMRRSGWGRIVNIASAHGLVASPFKSAYVAAKHGVVGFTKTAAWELADTHITVNAVCPGYVRTPLVENQIPGQARAHGIPESEVVTRVMLEPHAIKRMIEPAEVAALVVYLCSDAAAMVTGVAIPIDGGWTAH